MVDSSDRPTRLHTATMSTEAARGDQGAAHRLRRDRGRRQDRGLAGQADGPDGVGQRAAGHVHHGGVVPGQAQAGEGQRHGGRGGHHAEVATVDDLQEGADDAEEPRVAGDQEADPQAVARGGRRPAAGLVGVVELHEPGRRPRADPGEAVGDALELAVAADDQRGVDQRLSAGRPQRPDPVGGQAEDGDRPGSGGGAGAPGGDGLRVRHRARRLRSGGGGRRWRGAPGHGTPAPAAVVRTAAGAFR